MFSVEQFLKKFAPANTSTPARVQSHDFTSSSEDEDDDTFIPRKKVARSLSSKKFPADPYRVSDDTEQTHPPTNDQLCLSSVTSILSKDDSSWNATPLTTLSGNGGNFRIITLKYTLYLL